MGNLYDTKSWRSLRDRVRDRDGSCVFSGIAGACRGALHVHHIDPIADGGAPVPGEDGAVLVCLRHHRMLHGFLNRQNGWRRCPHQHRSREAREICEKNLNSARVTSSTLA